MTFFYVQQHIDEPKLADQQELSYSSWVRTPIGVWRTCQEWVTVGTDFEIVWGNSELSVWFDDVHYIYIMSIIYMILTNWALWYPIALNVNERKLIDTCSNFFSDIWCRNGWAVRYGARRVAIPPWNVLRVKPYWRIVIQQNRLYIYIYIYILTHRFIHTINLYIHNHKYIYIYIYVCVCVWVGGCICCRSKERIKNVLKYVDLRRDLYLLINLFIYFVLT